MYVFDAHCDALSKLWEHPDLSFARGDDRLQVSLPLMEKGNLRFQVFAAYVPNRIPYGRKFHAALEMIDLFYERVLPAGLQPILTRSDLEQAVLNRQKGAILFVEGGQTIEGSLTNLRILHRLGVRGMTLTWNHRNEIADGCHEPNPGGLSLFGRQVVQEMNRLGMIVDVSHVAEPGFWDVLELSDTPVIASHSNVKALCPHPRNLTDEQIKALIAKRGVIGLTFVDFFYTSEKRKVWINDLLRHLEHVLALGGLDHVALGSDFDGIVETFGDMTDAGQYPLLTEALLKRYKEAEVKKILCENWLRFFYEVLQ